MEIDLIKLAALARLRLEPEESERLERDIGKILEAFQTLQATDTEGVEPSARPFDEACPLRPDDEALPDVPRGQALVHDLAPARQGDFFVVPRVIGG